MKKFLLLIALAFCLNGRGQTWVTIPDANFVSWLQTNIPAAMSGNQMDITNTLVTTTVHTINVYNLNISDLNGIQYFTSLTFLNCETNSLTSLPALPDSLQTLYCDHNSLANLPALPNSIKNLWCQYNSLTTLPSLPDSLQNFWCDNNSLTSLPALPNKLNVLICYANHLTTLPVLPNSLGGFECSNNDITCFPPFPNSIYQLAIDPNPYNCLPNYIAAMDSTDLLVPLCAAGNASGCPIATSCTPVASYTLVADTVPHTWDIYPAYSSNVINARWYWGDGTDTLALYPSHTYSVAGRYNICVTAYSACGDSVVYCQSDSVYRTSSSSMVYINVKSSATGIEQITNSNEQVTIYPNPNNGSFVIEPSSTTKQTMQVYDVNGKMVLSQTINGRTSVDASSLNDGVYNINIISNEGVVNKRLVIVK